MTRTRVFLIADGELSRHWKVQANALGASLHVSRAAALAELRRRYSVVGRMALDARTEAELRQTRAGASIIQAGKSLAGLFSGVLGEDSFELADVSSAGVGVLKSVGTVGANEWLNTVREHHEGTFQHCLLVTGVAATYARQAGLSDVQAGALMNAALLHDIGKAVIPLHILDKPGKLSEEEFAVVKHHPSAAVLYLKSHVTVPPVVLDAVRHHHEYLDGSGYPDGLRGDQIRPLVRILTVCDIFAALVEQRAYKETKTPAQAVSILVDMTISSKLDYGAVRILAEAFGVKLPETFEDVVRNLVRPRTG